MKESKLKAVARSYAISNLEDDDGDYFDSEVEEHVGTFVAGACWAKAEISLEIKNLKEDLKWALQQARAGNMSVIWEGRAHYEKICKRWPDL